MLPVSFALMLFLVSALHWLPTSLVRLASPYGQGQVVAAHMLLIWWCFLRFIVAFVLTIPMVIGSRVIRPLQVFVLSIAAVAAELAAEVLLPATLGVKPGLAGQLAATAIAYSLVLFASRYFVREAYSDAV